MNRQVWELAGWFAGNFVCAVWMPVDSWITPANVVCAALSLVLISYWWEAEV